MLRSVLHWSVIGDVIFFHVDIGGYGVDDLTVNQSAAISLDEWWFIAYPLLRPLAIVGAVLHATADFTHIKLFAFAPFAGRGVHCECGQQVLRVGVGFAVV